MVNEIRRKYEYEIVFEERFIGVTREPFVVKKKGPRPFDMAISCSGVKQRRIINTNL